MGRTTKTYILTVIGAGALVLAYALGSLPPAAQWSWAVYTALTVLASVAQLRLPRSEGTFSLSFLFLLYGIAHFSLSETLIAGCAGAVVQCLVSSKGRASLLQILFNAANVAISVGACFLIGRVWLAAEMTRHLPVVLAAVGCTYFVVNTVLVSGVLSLLQSRRLADVCSRWYACSFPYYLVGVALVGLVPGPGQAVSGDAWLILLPVVYLMHFFLGLAAVQVSAIARTNRAEVSLPPRAQLYLTGVVATGLLALAAGIPGWQPQDLARFLVYLALGVFASTLKIQLPGVRGTITPGFVLLLAAVAQLSFGETAVMAAVLGVVQVLWRSTKRPLLAQVLFNPACLAVSAALAWVLSRMVLAPWLDNSVAGLLLISTLVLYGSNTILVAAMLALLDRKPLSGIWQLCHFWSLPYYLVGAAAAGIMTATGGNGDWPASLLVLPLMGLVYISYRALLGQAIAGTQPTGA
jgi:hypothetical protein